MDRNEAIKIVKNNQPTNNQMLDEALEFLIPELKESEDENIRKELIEYFKHYSGGDNVSIKFPEWIAWLENQSEQKPKDEVEPEFHSGDWVVDTVYDKAMKVLFLEDDGYEFENGIWISYADAKERVHLWTIKDAKDGDVLISKYGKPFIYNGNFDSVHIGSYCGISTVDSFNVATEICQWTENVDIHPATKEQRDLLFQKMKEEGYEWDADKKELLKKIKQNFDELLRDTRIQYESVEAGIESFAETYSFNIESNLFHQLTKEQQELWRKEIEQACISGGNAGIELARDMRYKENKPTEWSEEDEIGLGDALWAIKQARTTAKDENDMGNIWYAENWLKSLKERVQPQPKQDWSEEDEYTLNETIQHLEELIRIDKVKHLGCDVQYYQRDIDWLKSLKERIQPQWKPSKEQMKQLKSAADIYPDSRLGYALKSLYQDLMTYQNNLKSYSYERTIN